MILLVALLCAFGDQPSGAIPEVDPYRSCGLNALFVAGRLAGREVSFATLAAELNPAPDGSCSIEDLERASRRMGLEPFSARLTPESLSRLPLPAIVRMKSRAPGSTSNHYVVLIALTKKGVATIDPPIPAMFHPYSEFLNDWTGVAVCFPRNEEERRSLLEPPGSGPIGMIAGVALISLGAGIAFARRGRGGSRRAIVAASSALALISAGCGARSGPPRLVVETSVVDFGYVEPGVVPFSLKVSNQGGSDLRFLKVASTCSCAMVSPPSELPPGAAGVIEGKVTVVPGPGEAEVLVVCNDEGGRRRVQLRWLGKSKPTLTPSAATIQVSAGGVAESEFEVSYPSTGSRDFLKLRSVEGLPAGSTATQGADDPASIQAIPGLSLSSHSNPSAFLGKTTVRLKIQAPTAPGTTSIDARVKLQGPSGLVELPFAVTLKVDGGARSSPALVLLTAPVPADLKGVERRVHLVSDSPEERFQIVKIPGFLSGTIVPEKSGAGGRATLVLRVESAPPGDAPRDEIVVKAESGGSISIPIVLGLGL